MEKTEEIKANKLITPHFGLQEFVCPCCDRIKIVPGFFQHVELLERMRVELGFPIMINSAYRCPEHNKAVGGAVKSWHLLFATDIRPMDNDKEKLLKMYKKADELGFMGIGKYGTFIHCDLRPEKTRWLG